MFLSFLYNRALKSIHLPHMLLRECTGWLVLFPLHSSPHVTVWSGFSEGCSDWTVPDWEINVVFVLFFMTGTYSAPLITHWTAESGSWRVPQRPFDKMSRMSTTCPLFVLKFVTSLYQSVYAGLVHYALLWLSLWFKATWLHFRNRIWVRKNLTFI